MNRQICVFAGNISEVTFSSVVVFTIDFFLPNTEMKCHSYCLHLGDEIEWQFKSWFSGKNIQSKLCHMNRCLWGIWIFKYFIYKPYNRNTKTEHSLYDIYTEAIQKKAICRQGRPKTRREATISMLRVISLEHVSIFLKYPLIFKCRRLYRHDTEKWIRKTFGLWMFYSYLMSHSKKENPQYSICYARKGSKSHKWMNSWRPRLACISSQSDLAFSINILYWCVDFVSG